MKIPADILEASKEYDKQREDKREWLYQKEFNSYQKLATVLKKDEFYTRDKLADNWNTNHPKSKTIKQASDIKLNFNAIGDVLSRHLHYCKLGDSETDRVAFYDVMKGIYTLDYSFIQKCIFQVAPTLTEKYSYDVIYYLKQKASVKPLTKDKNLIVVGNGIFNLESKKLEPFSPDYVFTNKIDTKYNEKASDSPIINGWKFEDWLLEVSSDKNNQADKEVYLLLWQVIADSLNGNYSHQKLIALYSQHGASGKGTFQTFIKNLVGIENVGTLKINEFSERFAMSRVLNKSIVIGDDNPTGYIKDSSNLNSLVTGDLVNVEFKGKTGFTAEMSPTIVQSFNELPSFSNKGGTDRRLMIVPFNKRFQGSNDKREIKDKYSQRKDVLEHILYVALNKYIVFDKYVEPKVSKELLEEFRRENDSVKSFVDDEFINWNVNRITISAIYQAYKYYCIDNGFVPTSIKVFTNRASLNLDSYQKRTVRITKTNYLELKKIADDESFILPKGIDLTSKGRPAKCFVKND